MKVGSLFAGIGGFDLGLERAGYETAWQVEIDPYCQRILAKYWPTVPRYGDIRTVDWSTVEPVDLLCGGFPCQDISCAGKGAGLSGARSGLWSEYVKAIAALKPKYILIENVSALRSRGLDQVLREISALRYDAEWHCIPASAVGAPHRRDRVWIVAYAQREQNDAEWGSGELGHDTVGRDQQAALRDNGEAGLYAFNGCSKDVAHALLTQRHRWSDGVGWWEREPQETLQALGGNRREEDGLSIPESLLGRVAYGVPHRVDRLKGLGNAIVPQIAEVLGRMIQSHEPSVMASDESHSTRTIEGAANELLRGRNRDLPVVDKMWPTPCAVDHKGAGKTGALRDRLDYAVERGATKSNLYQAPTEGKLWPTPCHQGGGGINGGSHSRETLYKIVGETEGKKMGGSLNPNWVEWLMGYPLGWTDLKDSATPRKDDPIT